MVGVDGVCLAWVCLEHGVVGRICLVFGGRDAGCEYKGCV